MCPVSRLIAVSLLLLPGAGADAANPTSCTGGNFDPPNNGGSTNFVCAVSANIGAIDGMTLTSDVFHQFAPCVNEHTFRLFSPLGTEHFVGTRNGVQTTATITAFNGQSSNGNWTLRVTDSNPNDACGDRVNSWSLQFTLAGPAAPSVVFVDSAVNENGGTGLRVQVTTDGGGTTTAQGSVDIELDGDDPGSATLDSDYTLNVPTLVIPAGTPSGQSFVVANVIDDAALERNETIRLRFANPVGLTAAGTVHLVTISDDESGSVQFLTPSSTAQENDLFHVIPLRVVPSSSDGTATVGLSLFGSISRASGTATQGNYNQACPNQDWSFFEDPTTFNPSDDFFFNSGTSTWPTAIRLCPDGVADPDETIVFQINLSSPPANVTVSGTHTVTISEVRVFRNGFE